MATEKINWIDHLSPSTLNRFASTPSMFVLEKIYGYKSPASAKMVRGNAVEAGVAAGLFDLELPLERCVEIAVEEYNRRMILSRDPLRDKVLKEIPRMVALCLEQLRHYGKPSSTQGKIVWHPPELKRPIIGYYDFAWENHGLLIDLKTKSQVPKTIPHGEARQVAFYCPSDNIDAQLFYCSPATAKAIRLDDIRTHRQCLLNLAIVCENFLALSDDPEFYRRIIVPDLDSFYWGDSARNIAFEKWGI